MQANLQARLAWLQLVCGEVLTADKTARVSCSRRLKRIKLWERNVKSLWRVTPSPPRDRQPTLALP